MSTDAGARPLGPGARGARALVRVYQRVTEHRPQSSLDDRAGERRGGVVGAGAASLGAPETASFFRAASALAGWPSFP